MRFTYQSYLLVLKVDVFSYFLDMSTTYTGTPSLTNTIQIPQDLDNADAASVNVSAKAEIDNQVSLFQLYGQLMSSTSPIKIQCTDGVTIKVSPLSSVLLNVTNTWNTLLTTTESNVTAANVEGGGGVFVANTWYYLYVYSLAGVAAFQLTTTVPDGYRLYKNGSFGFKYLCAVRTDGSANVIPFTKYNGMTIYSGLENIGTGPPPPPDTNNITALASSNRIPITATIGKFGVLINTTPAGLSGEIRFYSSGLVTDPYISVTYPGNGYQSLYFDSPVDISQQLWYKVQPFTGATPGISYSCIGYYE